VTFLLWCDLETAGTDETRDPILEVAFLVTRENLAALASYGKVIRPAMPVDQVRAASVPDVRKMHDVNGLWGECAASDTSLAQADHQVTTMLRTLGSRHDFVLAGSGVAHFDSRFIRAQMPAVSQWIRYYCIDVGVIRRTMYLLGRDDLVRPADGKTHRAMDDVLLHLSEMQHFKDKLGKEPGR